MGGGREDASVEATITSLQLGRATKRL